MLAGAVCRVKLVAKLTVVGHLGISDELIAARACVRIRWKWLAAVVLNVPFKLVFVRKLSPASVASAVCRVECVAEPKVRVHVGNISFIAFRASPIGACLARFLVTVYSGLFGVFIRTAKSTRRPRIGSFAKSHVEFPCPASALEAKGAVGN